MLHLYTNGGYTTNQTQAMVLEYCKVWYYDKSITNIFSLTNFINKYRVTYDSHQYDYFTVHSNKRIINFRRNKKGIYVFKTTYTTENSNVVITVEENMVEITSKK